MYEGQPRSIATVCGDLSMWSVSDHVASARDLVASRITDRPVVDAGGGLASARETKCLAL